MLITVKKKGDSHLFGENEDNSSLLILFSAPPRLCERSFWDKLKPTVRSAGNVIGLQKNMIKITYILTKQLKLL